MTDYVVFIEKAEANWGAWSPDLGVYVTGDTQDEVADQIREAIDFHIEGLREDGLPIPEAVAGAITVAS